MRATLLLLAAFAVLVPATLIASEETPTPAAQAPPQGYDVLPFRDFRYGGSVGRTIEESDRPEFPQPARPPKGAPNIVYILIDDAGYGQFGTFGGQVPTPALDRVAQDGLRYTRFHTTAAVCKKTTSVCSGSSGAERSHSQGREEARKWVPQAGRVRGLAS